MKQEIQVQASNRTGFTSKFHQKQPEIEGKNHENDEKTAFFRAFSAGHFPYLYEIKARSCCDLTENAPTPTPPYTVKL